MVSNLSDEPRTGQGRMGMPMGGASRPWVFPFPCARVPSGGRVPARVPDGCPRGLCRVPLPAGGLRCAGRGQRRSG